MSENIKDLIAANPSGLLELQPAMTIPAYRENFGFNLKNIFTIYESKEMHHSHKEWFAFPGKTLENLFTVQEESTGDLLVVFLVEALRQGEIYCYLILSDEAYRNLMKTHKILQVHQMYTKFWRDHIALNTVAK